MRSAALQGIRLKLHSPNAKIRIKNENVANELNVHELRKITVLWVEQNSWSFPLNTSAQQLSAQLQMYSGSRGLDKVSHDTCFFTK